MSRRILAFVAAGLLAACVDVEGGDSGTYTSPCGSWGDLLLCGRESGGADPGGGGSPGGGGQDPDGATCADACAVVAECFGADPGECTAECQANPIDQSVLDCIVNAGCDYPSVCFGQ